ncbi:MAG: YnfA family protein [Chloroflexi bacterium]|nr:YnfA family protein [Chloroflexota bacterium]MDA1272086.1 YnfA family protein [Chloroflexota bacterium]
MLIAKSALLFFLAGLAEIGGGYGVWIWLRRDEPIFFAVLGGVALLIYGVIPTFQPETANFGKVYAAYGGVFVVMSLAWGWIFDKRAPDLYDVAGGAIVLFGIAMIMYWPRSSAA